MSLRYSHSYKHPDSGNRVDVMVQRDDEDEDEEDEEYRNAGPREHRDTRHIGRTKPRTRPQHVPERGGPVVVRQPNPPTVAMSGEYLAIRKSTVAELIPAAGRLWAAFLGLPARPEATGDDKTDRDNASLHREAIALHQQNKERIDAIADVVGRLLTLGVR